MVSNSASADGIRLNLLLGADVATPAPAILVERLQEVEIELGDEGNDGFQLTFGAGRTAGAVGSDSPIFEHPLLAPFSRVILQVSIGAQVEAVIDGFITYRQAQPGDEPGSARLTVTGEDVRVMMDVEERTVNHYGLSPDIRVMQILLRYQRYLGLPPTVLPARSRRVPSPTEHMPTQIGTDLSYVRRLARENAHVFYVEPGRMPNTNLAYWGPPPRGERQPALTVNAGPHSNARIQFAYDSLRPEAFSGAALDPATRTLQPLAAQLDDGGRLSLNRARDYQRGIVRKTLARRGLNLSVLDVADSGNAAAQRSNAPLSATVELDVAAYGHLLKPRRIVGVRGAGQQLDGLYYVKRVSHAIRRGSYVQQGTLERDGVGRSVGALT